MENASGKNAKSCSAFTNVHELSTALDSGKMTIFAFLIQHVHVISLLH